MVEIAGLVDSVREHEEPFGLWIRKPDAKPSHLMALSGTFNPPTTAHTGLIEAAMKQGAKPATFVVAVQSVDKENLEIMSIEDRLVLLDVIASRIGATVAIVNHGLYVDQARAMKGLAPDRRIVFLTGYDKIAQVFDPKYYDNAEKAWNDLFEVTDFLVAQRGNAGTSVLHSLLRRPDIRRWARNVTPFKVPDDVDRFLSSSMVRSSAVGGASLGKSLPPESLAFIRYWQPYVEGSRYLMRISIVEQLKRFPEIAADAPGLRSLVSTLEASPSLREAFSVRDVTEETVRSLVAACEARSTTDGDIAAETVPAAP